jgi:hypothetical protein
MRECFGVDSAKVRDLAHRMGQSEREILGYYLRYYREHPSFGAHPLLL